MKQEIFEEDLEEVTGGGKKNVKKNSAGGSQAINTGEFNKNTNTKFNSDNGTQITQNNDVKNNVGNVVIGGVTQIGSIGNNSVIKIG